MSWFNRPQGVSVRQSFTEVENGVHRIGGVGGSYQEGTAHAHRRCFFTSGWASQACSRQDVFCDRTLQSHSEHLKHAFGRHISLKRDWRARVPLTPLSSATSHSRRHDVWEAMRAAGAADDGQSEEADDSNMVRSDLRMLSLHDLTTLGAFSGSDMHLARTQRCPV